MRRVGSRETRDPVDAVTGLRIGMSRFRVGLAVVAMTMTVVFTAGGGVANAAPIQVACPAGAGTTTGSLTFTLTADCGPVTEPITVPNGITVEGDGNIISATDPNATTSFTDGVVTNAQGPGSH